jgi:hypothetical protein
VVLVSVFATNSSVNPDFIVLTLANGRWGDEGENDKIYKTGKFKL